MTIFPANNQAFLWSLAVKKNIMNKCSNRTTLNQYTKMIDWPKHMGFIMFVFQNFYT